MTLPREIPLARAAHRIRRPYLAARDLLLKGELAGRQDDRGRWLVEESSIEQFLAARAAGAR